MSYDIYYRTPSCSHCGALAALHRDDSFSPTFNLRDIFWFCLGEDGVYSLHGVTGAEAAPRLRAALSLLSDPANAEHVKGMEPENGWGNAEGAAETLSVLLYFAELYPKGIIDTQYGGNIPDEFLTEEDR